MRSFVSAVSGSGVGGRDLVTMAATEPQSLLLNLGDLAMLWCYSTGRPVPGAKWSRMDKQLTTVGGGGTGEYVLHSDGVLEIRSLQTKDFGAYRCHPNAVTNGHQPIGLAWINQDSVSSKYAFLLLGLGFVTMWGSTGTACSASSGKH